MKRLRRSLLLMLSAVALRGQIDDTGAATEVTIYTRFAQPASSRSIEYMKAELSVILPPLSFAWRSLELATGRQVANELVVVSFKGACHADGLFAHELASGALGSTYITEGQLLPFADVDCDMIRALLGSRLAVSAPMERARMMGRAMARILAHELYHYLTRTKTHSSSGMAKAFYTAADLASDNLRFDETQLRLVRQSCSHRWPAETHGAAGAGE